MLEEMTSVITVVNVVHLNLNFTQCVGTHICAYMFTSCKTLRLHT